MAQRIYIKKFPSTPKLIIDDYELCLFEFQEFFESVNKKSNIKIDGYSGGIIKHSKNRELFQVLSIQLYKIQDSFPEAKTSAFEPKNQISKKAVVRFFQNLLSILQQAFDHESDIFINGE